MSPKIIDQQTDISKLQEMAKASFGNLVKAVVDIQKQSMAIGGEMHADEERFLIENGSKQDDLWGINIYPFQKIDQLIEFDSVINLRPSQKNLTRGIENTQIRQKIIQIVKNLIKL